MNFFQLLCYLSRIKEIVFPIYPSCDSSNKHSWVFYLTILLALTKSPDFPTIYVTTQKIIIFPKSWSPDLIYSWWFPGWIRCVFSARQSDIRYLAYHNTHTLNTAQGAAVLQASSYVLGMACFSYTADDFGKKGMLDLMCWWSVVGWHMMWELPAGWGSCRQTDRQAGPYTHAHMCTCARAHKPWPGPTPQTIAWTCTILLLEEILTSLRASPSYLW